MRLQRFRTAGVAAFGAFALSIAVTTGVLAAGMYGTNLVVNGNAEAGPGAPSNSGVMKPPGWTTTGEFTAVKYGASGGFPDMTSPGPSDRGANFFAGGNVPVSTATQTISLAAGAADIDKGTVTYVFSAWLVAGRQREGRAHLQERRRRIDRADAARPGPGEGAEERYRFPAQERVRRGSEGRALRDDHADHDASRGNVQRR